jgi:pimeloyl-ACP methyl ester carboxylesterase
MVFALAVDRLLVKGIMAQKILEGRQMPREYQTLQNLSGAKESTVGTLLGKPQPNQCKTKAFVALGVIVAFVAGTPLSSNAQKYEDLSVPNSPLVLQATGSFYVGGRTVSMTETETGLYGGGSLVVDQMYVQYMVPQGHSKPAVVMVHGSTLSGKSFETTPDGRMGWYEYFARKGYPSYVVDQVARGRSGFNPAVFNDVRAGLAPPASQPNLRRVTGDIARVRFRIGPVVGGKFDDTQFPVEASEEFAKQSVPDQTQGPTPKDPNFSNPSDPNYIALSELAKGLKGTVIMGHSQAGRYPFETALLEPNGIKALIAIEPPGCKASEYTDEQIATLAKFPILVVFGDHVETPQTVGPNWLPMFKDCQAFVARINAAKGDATMLHPVEIGIHGNSHMIMQDKNNLQIADLIMNWINLHAG